MKKVTGQSFTSNHVKLLKHLDKLKIIQDGELPLLLWSICLLAILVI